MISLASALAMDKDLTKQVVVAASDGCIAAMSIDKYLKGRKSVKVDWIHQ